MSLLQCSMVLASWRNAENSLQSVNMKRPFKLKRMRPRVREYLSEPHGLDLAFDLGRPFCGGHVGAVDENLCDFATDIADKGTIITSSRRQREHRILPEGRNDPVAVTRP